MNLIMQKHRTYADVYLDDIIIHSASLEEHAELLFQLLLTYNCTFHSSLIPYLQVTLISSSFASSCISHNHFRVLPIFLLTMVAVHLLSHHFSGCPTHTRTLLSDPNTLHSMPDPLTAAALEAIIEKLSRHWIFDIPNDATFFLNPIHHNALPYPIKSSRTPRHSSHTKMYKWLFTAWTDTIRQHADALYNLAEQLESRMQDHDDKFYIATILDEHRHLQIEISRQADFLHFDVAFAAYQQHLRYTKFLRESTLIPNPPLNEISRAIDLFRHRWAYVPFPSPKPDTQSSQPNIPLLLPPPDRFNSEVKTPHHPRPPSSSSSHHVIKRNKIADPRSATPSVDESLTIDDHDADAENAQSSVLQSILQDDPDEYYSAQEDDDTNM